jgi:hypothetical protein
MNKELEFLSSSAVGLDFSNSEDRAIFRERVAYRLRYVLVSTMKEWVKTKAIDRATVVRAVSDEFIKSNYDLP